MCTRIGHALVWLTLMAMPVSGILALFADGRNDARVTHVSLVVFIAALLLFLVVATPQMLAGERMTLFTYRACLILAGAGLCALGVGAIAAIVAANDGAWMLVNLCIWVAMSGMFAFLACGIGAIALQQRADAYVAERNARADAAAWDALWATQGTRADAHVGADGPSAHASGLPFRRTPGR